jgi:hypothetical protein
MTGRPNPGLSGVTGYWMSELGSLGEVLVIEEGQLFKPYQGYG